MSYQGFVPTYAALTESAKSALSGEQGRIAPK